MFLMRSLEYVLGVFIGGITFTGSIVAMGKLQGIIPSPPLILGEYFRHVLNLGICIISFLCFIPFMYFMCHDYRLYVNTPILFIVMLLSFFVGWHLVMAIGGADMPVVVSMLNSYSGWATSAIGFLLDNYAMIVSGALIGASGAILSYIMCKAMNRSFMNVILGGFGIPTKATQIFGTASFISPLEFAQSLQEAKYITIVPGYGMAVAKAQHVVAEMTTMLLNMKKRVVFIIHPVAGRLPGHMNVLLAEANVSYKIVKSMEEVDDIKDSDVSIVVGANDIINPIAQTDPGCPLAGMPIIECYKAKLCIVNKRSLGHGYAAVDNPLFFYPNTKMYLKDAKIAFEELNTELKKLLTKPERKEVDTYDENTRLLSQEREQEDQLKQFAGINEDINIGVLKETEPELMVAMIPLVAKQLRTKGYGFRIETTAGVNSAAEDLDYVRSGCRISTRQEIFSQSHIILKVQPPTEEEIEEMNEGTILISFFYPSKNQTLLQKAAHKRIIVIAMDRVPRLSITQSMDALSSMTNLTGYRSIVDACNLFGRTLSGQHTAAGKTDPAKVFVIGCGIAGLAAIRTAKGLGAIVKATDVRRASKDQAESVGAEFISMDLEDLEEKTGYAKEATTDVLEVQKTLFRSVLPEVDIVISTANVPGRKSPVFITKDMLDNMKIGSVIVDLAIQNGGNCEVTRPDEIYMYNNRIYVVGTLNLLLKMVPQASQFYSQNIMNLLNYVSKKASDFKVETGSNEVMKQMVATENGVIPQEYNMQVVSTPIAPKQDQIDSVHRPKTESFWLTGLMSISLCLVLMVMMFLPDSFVQAVMSFVLAIIVGFYVVWSVTSALHTPLMSVTNAISGIIAVSSLTKHTSSNNTATNFQGNIEKFTLFIDTFSIFFNIFFVVWSTSYFCF